MFKSINVGNAHFCKKYFTIDSELYVTNYFRVLICFEALAKLAQQCLVCAPLEIHFEQINKELMLVGSDNIIINNCAVWPNRELCNAK